MPEPATSLPVEHLFRMSLVIDGHHMITNGPEGTKVVAPIASGDVDGPRLRGTIVPHSGADWLSIGPAGEMRIDVRATIATDDGAHILMTYRGVLVDGVTRAAPLFETGDDRYRWLNTIQAIGIGTANAGAVVYEIYALA